MEKERIYKKLLGEWEAPFDKSETDAWKELELRLPGVAPKGRLVRMNRRIWASAAAAAVLVVMTTWLWPSTAEVTASCGAGERTQVTLPDGSLAYLNASSQLTFSPEWKDSREVKLSGEAFFEVKKGERFTVITANGEVEVLGTSFNVFSRENRFSVECSTGKVGVTHSGSEMIIIPGEKVTIAGNDLLKSNFDPKAPAWRDGYFEYFDEPLINVLHEMERQFNVTIEATDIDNKFYTGPFENDNLEEALSIVFGRFGYKWEIKSNMVVVLTKL